MQDNDVKPGNVEGTAPSGPVKRWPILAIAAVIIAAVVAIVVVLALRGSTEEPITPSQKVRISIDAPATVAAGSGMTASVAIENIVNFDSTNFEVSYNPDVLELTAVTDGTINATVVPVSNWGFMPSGVQGKVAIICNVPGVPGVNGSGSLCELHFNVIGDSGDTSNIDFTGEWWVSDNRAVRINIPEDDWEGAVLSVE